MSDPAPPAATAAWIVAPETASGFALWGLTPVERLRRSLARAGCSRVQVLGAGEKPDGEAAGPAVVLRADWIYDERLVAALLAREVDTLLAADDGSPVAARVEPQRLAAATAALQAGAPPPGLRGIAPRELAPAYMAHLRKSEPPYLLRARAEARAAIEAHTFSASYKGATDLVTKWVWPVPARWATRQMARAHVHPNSVTVASWGLAIAAFWCFLKGAYGLGLAAAWGMTFLDTVDGKLARVTLTSSKLGDVLDHGLDLVHPPFWWWAWGAGLGWEAHPATLVVVAGYFVGRALEGAFLATFHLETHSWRPVDTLFRTITARRNPNLILFSVGTAAGRPDLGMVMVAAWTLVSLGFHAVRLLQALLARRRGAAIEPWNV